jgi:GTP:adenosylcobinamide-phosphate guanylyltransferase
MKGGHSFRLDGVHHVLLRIEDANLCRRITGALTRVTERIFVRVRTAVKRTNLRSRSPTFGTFVYSQLKETSQEYLQNQTTREHPLEEGRIFSSLQHRASFWQTPSK